MNLVDIIKGFISKENTDFAILVNGTWGSGKTFFIKNIIAEEAKKITCKLSAKENKPFELVYVSLYGLTSADELQKRLFLELNPSLKTRSGKIIASLFGKGLELLGIGVNDKDEKNLLNIFGGIPKNKILVFDDLERLSPDTLNEVFGFINTYTEHQNLKVIIVADEEKISGKITDYDGVKEKLIRFTYSFHPELKEVFPNFVKRYNYILYQHFLADNINSICDIFDRGKHKNLRSLRFVLDLLESVFNSVNSIVGLAPSSKKTLFDRFVLLITTYSIEYKKGTPIENLNALKNIGGPLGMSTFDTLIFKQMRNDMIKSGELKEESLSVIDKYTMQFEEAYLPEDTSGFEYYDFLVAYIHSGDLDLELMTSYCLKAQDILNEQKHKPEQIALHKLKNCLTLNDNEYIPLINEIYGYIDAGSYKLEEYPIIFQNLLNGAKEGIANLTIDGATVSRFKDGMKKSLKHSQYRNGFNSYISMVHQNDTLLDEIRAHATALNETLLIDSDKELAERVFNLMTSEKFAEFSALMTSDEIRVVPIFQERYIDPKEFIKKYDLLSNREKLTVNEILNQLSSRYSHSKGLFSKELPFLDVLLDVTNKKIDAVKENKQLSTTIYRQLNHWIGEIIKTLK